MNEEQLNDVWNQLLADLPRYGALSAERRAAIGETLRETELGDTEAVDEFLAVLGGEPPAADGREQVLALFLQHSVQPWLQREPESALPPDAVRRLVAWYQAAGCEALRLPILRTLAIDGYPAAAGALAELVAADPPADDRQSLLALVPLFQPRTQPLAGAAALFPRLLDAVSSPVLAPAVLDLANFLSRREVLPEHPAKARAVEFSGLLLSLIHI